MASSEELSYAFLEAHPVDAARVLERLAPESAAALLQSAPLRLASPVLRQMLPLAGARCLEQLDDSETIGLLRGVGAQAGVALLRHFGAERRAQMLAQLPTALTIAYELLLGYPEGTVGAWMDPHALALPADMNSGDSLERVRQAKDAPVTDPYVIDRNQRLMGYVELADLLRADAFDSAYAAGAAKPAPAAGAIAARRAARASGMARVFYTASRRSRRSAGWRDHACRDAAGAFAGAEHAGTAQCGKHACRCCFCLLVRRLRADTGTRQPAAWRTQGGQIMSAGAEAAIAALNLHFLLDYPREAARRIEAMPPDEVSAMLAAQPVHAVLPVWHSLATDVEQAVFTELPEPRAVELLAEMEPARSAALLSRLEEEEREHFIGLLNAQVAAEIRKLMQYPPDSAGQFMDPRALAFRGELTAHEALARLRQTKRRGLRELYVVDDDGRLEGRVDIQDLALADPDEILARIARKIVDAVQDTASREDVVEKMQQDAVTDLPVIDFDGRLVGVIHQAMLASAVQQETTLDILTMVGASRDERALSSATFAVLKRLPWLQINLLTAFLAAAVVGLFESTIAKYTALAVLLPVVAGQSGNAGAQALAVTMRGLVLREISLRHWPRVVFKEFNVGLMNGLAIAATTAIGVYIWSGSLGLVLVIAAAMVISMVAAGFAGALVPIMLQRFGQDPAQSSSIILTTVTDVVGFFSFLGIATLFSSLL